MRRRLLRSVAGLVVTGSVLAGCASTVDGIPTLPSGSRGSATGSRSGANAATAPSTQTLQRLVVQRDDLPTGWVARTAAGVQTGSGGPILLSHLATCLGIRNPGRGAVRTASSSQFGNGPRTISTSVTAYRAQSYVQGENALLNQSGAERCFVLYLTEQTRGTDPQVRAGDVDLRLTTTQYAGIGNVVGLVQTGITFSDAGQRVRLYLDIAFFTGRLLTGIAYFSSQGPPLSPDTVASVTRIVAGRVANA